jgi:preprotein translocase subunit SecE
MAVVSAFVFYACYCWYYGWKLVLVGFIGNRIFTEGMRSWMVDGDKYFQIGGTALLALLGGCVAYYYVYVRPRTVEFLIKTDVELAKVTWPKVQPWFKSESQVWGATYVVLITMAFLTLYVFFVDNVFQLLATWLFYSG